MVQRKTFQDKPIKAPKIRAPRPVSKKLDLSALPDVVVEGKCVATPGSKIIASRWGNREIHDCTFIKFDEKFNLISLWDDTVNHMYDISLNEELPATLKIKMLAKLEKAVKAQVPVLSDGTNVVEANDVIEQMTPGSDLTPAVEAQPGVHLIHGDRATTDLGADAEYDRLSIGEDGSTAASLCGGCSSDVEQHADGTSSAESTEALCGDGPHSDDV